MRTQILSSLGYQVPERFQNRENAFNYLSSCGVKNPKLSLGKLYYFLHNLRVTPHLPTFESENGWVNISSVLLEKLFGSIDYVNAIVKKLLEDNLIEVYKGRNGKESYRVGHYCKRYRLTRELNDEEWKVVRVNSSSCSTTRKVIAYNTKNWKAVDNKLFEDLTQFNIDEIEFFEKTTVNNFRSFRCPILKEINKKTKEKLKEKKRDSFEDCQKDIYKSYKDAYNAIRAKAWRYTIDDNGRRHTNITNLPKILRSFLYIDKGNGKERLITVDVSNSQVLLLLTILSKRHNPSFNKFKELVETGEFYEFLCSRMNKKATEQNRKRVKQNYFTIVYGDNKKPYVWNNQVFRIIKDEFPDIVKTLHKIKNQQGYAAPSHLMQQQESNIIINSICKRLHKLRIFHTQIYDSILCFENDIENVNKIMKESFADKGFIVNLKKEN